MRAPQTSAAIAARGLLLALLALQAGAAAARGEALKTHTLAGDVVLVRSDGGSWLESAGNRRLLALDPGVELTSLAAAGEGWYAAGVGRSEEGPRLVLLAGRGATARPLPAPATSAPWILSPVVLARRDLEAVAWLEGESYERLAVKVAHRSEGRWQEAVTVAPPGAGSQLALSGAALPDGELILVWSAFDGEDDEIVFSRFRGRGWSAPARLAENNAVPDVTPHLRAIGDRVLVVWSRYDGNDYRINLARYRDGTFTPPRIIGGRGTVFPTLIDDRGTPLVLYKTAVPRHWTVAELDASGAVARRASVPRPSNARPIVERTSSGDLLLRWPGTDLAGVPLAFAPATER
ncbi:MAG: hypothetical protein D6696_09735 [Acidobacteria bacterium]|nr:MAG: hypothetical protein D6696_09735 [Acidobacteriota bacterium]